MTDDLYDQGAGSSDVKYLFALFPPVPLPHILHITRQHKVLVYASVFLASLKKFNVLKPAGTT